MVVAFIAPVGGGSHGTPTAVGGGASNRQLALQLVARLSASREESQARVAAERQKQEAPPINPAV